MNASRSKRRIRLTPFGYLVLSAFIAALLGSVYLIARAAGGASLTPRGQITGSGNPLNVPDPNASPDSSVVDDALNGLVNGALADTEIATPTPVPTPVPTPTIYITPVPDPTVSPTPSPTPASVSRTPSPAEVAGAVDGKLSTGGVNLRAGPSTNDNIIGTDFAKGTKVKVYALENDYYFVQIVAKERYGYISSKFVSVAGFTPQPVATAEPPTGAIGGRIRASKAMLRNGPGTDYGAIDQYVKGDPVYVFFKSGDWYYVQMALTGEKGYMKADFITVEADIPSGTPIP